MTALLIIADDLTGAADTGARFADCGIDTRLLMDWGQDFSMFAGSGEIEAESVPIGRKSHVTALKDRAQSSLGYYTCT